MRHLSRVKMKIPSNSDDIGCSNLANRPTTWQEIKLNLECTQESSSSFAMLGETGQPFLRVRLTFPYLMQQWSMN